MALAGFDVITPRRLLGDAGFTRVVDAGLGTGHIEYLDMVLHTFPAAEDPATAFIEQRRRPRPLGEAYEAEICRQKETGADATPARCGMLDIAGVTVGAKSVGTFASTLVMADILRVLHGGESYSVIAVDLRDPPAIRAVPNSAPREYTPPAHTAAR